VAVQHLVLIETNVGVTDAQIEGLLDGVTGLKGKIPGVLDVKIGKNFTDRAPHISVAGVITLADKASLAAYGPHPAHQDVLKVLAALAKSVTIADIET
jgi:hypothetical protein